jgi:hypothetical protein
VWVEIPSVGTGVDDPRSHGDGVDACRRADQVCENEASSCLRFPPPPAESHEVTRATNSREVPIRARALSHTGARGRAVAAVMAHSPASKNGPPGGVVRVRVEEYEKLMGSMLEEAERRIAEAREARDRAVAEAETLRSALEASERQKNASKREFDTWRAALVDAAADELEVETRRWRAVVAEKDAAIAAKDAVVKEWARRAGGGTATESTDHRELNDRETVTRSPSRGGVSSGDGNGTGGPESHETEARAATSSAEEAAPSPPPGTHKKKHHRSRSAAPVAESPAALGDVARKAEAAAKMRAAVAAGEAASAGRAEGGGSGPSGTTNPPQKGKDERTSEFGFWPFW